MGKRIAHDHEWRHQDGGRGWMLRWSGQCEVIADHWMPTWMEFETHTIEGPNFSGRVELRDAAPRVVKLGWSSEQGQSEIRLRDLRPPRFAFDFLTKVFAGLTYEHESPAWPESVLASFAVGKAEYDAFEKDPVDLAVEKFIERQRRPDWRRDINKPAFLQAVAEVYRRNIQSAPTQAVAQAFGVKSRMASTYVDRARQAGLLPKTKQGQKKA